jgi:iron complex transport system ATP-binding protein
VYDDADRDRARQLGERMGLAGHLDQDFGTLSAGERRRTSIARALMPDPDVLVLDEPMASLDLVARELLLADLGSLAREPGLRAILLVSHHLEEIPSGFGHALVLHDGRALAAGPSASVIRDEILSEAFAMPLRVEGRDGRWTARMRPGG